MPKIQIKHGGLKTWKGFVDVIQRHSLSIEENVRLWCRLQGSLVAHNQLQNWRYPPIYRYISKVHHYRLGNYRLHPNNIEWDFLCEFQTPCM